MNYRTMVKGALAFSLSLIVGTAWAADTQTYGVTFEPLVGAATVENDHNYTNNMPITDATLHTGSGDTAYGWLAAAEDESKIIERVAEGSTQALQLNTDANTLTNKFASDVATGLNTAIAGDGAFFETEVKFVASDTLDAGIKGGQDATKFAIYAYCDDQAETVTTNLVVFHGIMDGNTGIISYTNEIFNTLVNCDVYTKLRIEMKKFPDPVIQGLSYNAFTVKVGDSPLLESDTALDATLGGAATGIWFLTVEDTVGNVDNELVSSLNFKGTGEIDNIKAGVITTIPPAATVFTVAGNVTNNIVEYTTLAEAIAAATDGQTVLVLKDLELDARVEPNVGANTSITIDLGGKTITRTGTSGNGSVFDVKSGDVLIKNGTIDCTQDDTAIAADGVYAITSRSGSNVTLADLTITVNSECGACAYPFAGSTMTIESGTYANTTTTPYRYNTAITGMAVNQPNNATQNLFIKGGTFSKYDPQLGDDSGAMTDFTDDGFVAISDGNGNWVVQPGYNVTFDANGGSPVPEAQRVATGGTATAPATAPTKEGVTFGGWQLNGAAYNFDTVLSADITLVASWTQAGSDEYKANDTIGTVTLTDAMATWLNRLKGDKTKSDFEAELDDGDSYGLVEEYLLNTDPTKATVVEFKVTSIAVGTTVDLQVTLTRTENNAAVETAINGELQILGATSLDGTFGNGEAVDATFEGVTTASKSLTTQAKFFKAVIVEKTVQAGE